MNHKKEKSENDSKKQKILEWYCREGYLGTSPDCDKHCPAKRGENPCFNYRILRQLLTGVKF